MTQSSWVSMIVFFFFNDTATTEIYTLSLHDALPIFAVLDGGDPAVPLGQVLGLQDRGPGVPRRTGGPRGLGGGHDISLRGVGSVHRISPSPFGSTGRSTRPPAPAGRWRSPARRPGHRRVVGRCGRRRR